ncbi:ATP-dependent helicase [Candidatus Palauibacter sp.]|uniref:ATP-dependent helicase n=1 Tax=Candidatus Palauibacter sp. TaxID=3101350 RepID=UPI003B5C4664
MITFDNLNENQRRAVGWDQGPLLVLAGPGSGKTGVLTLRVARLLEENESASVLALTFTNKAATEMRERVHDLLEERADRAQLCTFHSFATDVLAQHGSHLGIRSDFRHLVRDEDRMAILEDVIDGLDEDLPADRKGLLHVIDRLFSESYAGEGESSSLAATPAWLPTLYRRYCDALIDANRLDFGSLLCFAGRLLREKPAVARVVRLGWTHVCVDEFQDTNRAQYELLRLIAPTRSHSLFVVADDDQIIYQWNGASPERLLDLRRDYDLRTIQLPESYRCPPAIVALANRLIGHNTRRIAEKSILAVHDPQQAYAGEVRYDVFPSPRKEAEFVGRNIRERGLPSSDCVVLGRTTRLVRNAADGLLSAGYDAYVPVRKSEFDSPAANVLVEALRSANSPHDRVVLRRLCLAWEGLTGVVVDPQSVEAAAALFGGNFLRAWVQSAEAVAGGWERALQRIRTDLVDALRFPAVVDWFLEGGWESWDRDDREESTSEEIATWKGLHGEIVAEYGDGVTLNSYLQQLDLASKTPPPAPDALRCMTVHQAKGLEFKHVYLIGMAQEVFPSIYALRKGADSRQVEEERRSCFVAVTRTRDTLTLTRSRSYYGYPKDPSQFPAEMGVASRS